MLTAHSKTKLALKLRLTHFTYPYKILDYFAYPFVSVGRLDLFREKIRQVYYSNWYPKMYFQHFTCILMPQLSCRHYGLIIFKAPLPRIRREVREKHVATLYFSYRQAGREPFCSEQKRNASLFSLV